MAPESAVRNWLPRLSDGSNPGGTSQGPGFFVVWGGTVLEGGAVPSDLVGAAGVRLIDVADDPMSKPAATALWHLEQAVDALRECGL